jgi:NADH dehydrogenase [ubiquinone] 1 alpha subcomplex assembly factor 5
VTIPAIFDRKLIRARRERAARAGEMPDFLLRRVGEEMMDRLSGIERQFAPTLAVGAVPGVLSAMLRERGGDGPVIEMAASPALLSEGAAPSLCGEEELFPFKDGALGLIVSGLTLQLANDLPGTLVQIRRALKPDGLFLAALLGGQTLTELREAFIAAETELEGGASPRVMPTGDVRDYGALLQRAGFALPVADSDLITVTYATPLALIRDLRAMGAANALTQRRRRFLRRATLLRALEIYQERFPAGKDGRVRASFEVIHLAGWGPHESQQKPLRPGSAAARLADALGTEEHKLKG